MARAKSLRRKFRKTERAAKIELEIVSDITPHLDEVYPLYLAVHERSPMKFEKLTKEYLSKLGQLMPERVRFFIWRLDRRIIAFSICMVHDGYDLRRISRPGLFPLRSISTFIFTRCVTFCDGPSRIALTFYCSSPLNYDPKLHLGLRSRAARSLRERHTQPLLNPIFRRVVRLLEPTRHDPVLPKFSNAAELMNDSAGCVRACKRARRGNTAFGRSRACLRACSRCPDGILGARFFEHAKDFQYYELIEQTMGSAFEYRYLAVFDRTNRPVALQPLVLTTQDLAVSASEAIVRFVSPNCARSGRILAKPYGPRRLSRG